MNKENNANVQNVSESLSVSNVTYPNQICGLDKDQESNINHLINKASMANVNICNMGFLLLVQNA